MKFLFIVFISFQFNHLHMSVIWVIPLLDFTLSRFLQLWKVHAFWHFSLGHTSRQHSTLTFFLTFKNGSMQSSGSAHHIALKRSKCHCRKHCYWEWTRLTLGVESSFSQITTTQSWHFCQPLLSLCYLYIIFTDTFGWKMLLNLLINYCIERT